MNSTLKHLTLPLYLFAVLLVVVPLTDLAASIWPFRLSDVEWRFGTFGLLSNVLLLPMLGAVTIVLLAVVGGHARNQMVMVVVHGLVATLLIIALPIFALDSLELRSRVMADAKLTFDIAAVKAFVVQLLVSAVLAIMSISGYKSWGATVRRRKTRSAKEPMLVVPVAGTPASQDINNEDVS